MNKNLADLANSPQDAGLFWQTVLGMASKKMRHEIQSIKLRDPDEGPDGEAYEDPSKVAGI